jgi:hypothetical protein
MRKIRYGLIALCLLSCSVTSATAQVSIGIGLPNVSIGIHLPLFPELVPVPGYPVYYAPQVDSNYFFYDGMYWVFQNDNWYASSWYNGPWGLVDPYAVPVFILRIPVRYYRQPPMYFRGWRSDAPPRWGQHWGHGWEQRRRGWDRWQRSSAPARAPLPLYQRQYSGDRYPRHIDQQRMIGREHYRYQPHDRTVRRHFQQQGEQRAPVPAQRGRREEPRTRSPRQQDIQRSMPPQHGGPAGPRSQPPHRGGENIQRPVPASPQQRGPAMQGQRQQPGAAQRMQQAPRPQSQEPKQGHGQGQQKDEGRGR